MEITLETVVFYFLAVFITVCSILTVTTRRMVRSATYLLFTLSVRQASTSCWDIPFWDRYRSWYMPAVLSYSTSSPSC